MFTKVSFYNTYHTSPAKRIVYDHTVPVHTCTMCPWLYECLQILRYLSVSRYVSVCHTCEEEMTPPSKTDPEISAISHTSTHCPHQHQNKAFFNNAHCLVVENIVFWIFVYPLLSLHCLDPNISFYRGCMATGETWGHEDGLRATWDDASSKYWSWWTWQPGRAGVLLVFLV